HLSLDVALRKVLITLPRLSFGVPPRLVPDSRIQVEPLDVPGTGAAGRVSLEQPKDEDAAPAALSYDLRVRTAAPAQLRSNLAKALIPVSTDLTVRSKPQGSSTVEGDIRVGSFPIELFRREARIQSVRLGFEPGR